MNRTLWDLLCEKKSYDVMISTFSPHYEKFFPIEIRHYLAEWFEDQICTSPSADDAQFFDFAIQFQSSLIEKIEKLAESINDNESVENSVRKFRFFEASGKLRYYTADGLLSDLCNIMEHERYLYTNNSMATAVEKNLFDEQVKALELNSVDIENKFNKLIGIFQNFQCELFEAKSHFENNLASNEFKVQQIANDIQADYVKSQLTQTRDELFTILNIFIESSQQIVDDIVHNQIEMWKEHQKMFSGSAFVDLENIQKWCEKVSNSLHKVNENVAHINDLQHKLYEFDNYFTINPNLVHLCDLIQQLFFKLVTSSLVIEEQPSQIIKIGNKIKASVRLLVGSDYHDKDFIPCVEAFIVSESKAREILKNNKLQGRATGEMLHNSANMATNKSKQFCANFRTMQLLSIQRSTKRDVTDEKFAICFSTVLKFHNFEVPMTLMSLPIVVIVHVNQETSALATIIWDSSFSKVDRVPFETSGEVLWTEFSKVFSKIFKEEVGRELSDENLHFLAEKFYDRDLSFPLKDFDQVTVTWSEFCKKKLSAKDFTFWEWIYLTLKLIKECISNYWREGYIEGFISKGNVEKKLRNSPKGTFILRFSDSFKGSVSVAYVMSNNAGKPSIMHVQPFTIKDLTMLSLTERLNAFDELKVLYPNLDKKLAFRVDENSFLKFRDRNGYIIPLQTSRLPSYYEVNKKILMN